MVDRFPCRKLHSFCSRNLQRFTAPRVATGACRTLAGAEVAETDQLNDLALNDCLRHTRDECVDGLARGALAYADGRCHGVNQFLLVHIHSLRFCLTSCHAGAGRNASPYRRRLAEANRITPQCYPTARHRRSPIVFPRAPRAPRVPQGKPAISLTSSSPP